MGCMCVYMCIGELSVSGIDEGCYDFCSLFTAMGKKPFLSLLVRVLGVLSLPEGKLVKNGFLGCERSCWMFVACVRRQFEWMSHRFGSGKPTILLAVFTTCCRSFCFRNSAAGILHSTTVC